MKKSFINGGDPPTSIRRLIPHFCSQICGRGSFFDFKSEYGEQRVLIRHAPKLTKKKMIKKKRSVVKRTGKWEVLQQHRGASVGSVGGGGLLT